jgi:hypothetical protein
MNRLLVVAALVCLASCFRQLAPSGGTSSLNPAADSALYTQRAGIAVNTGGRTCLSIRNGNLPVNSPITLVLPNLPQAYIAAQIGAASESPCPITKEVDRTVTSYELHLPGGTDGLRKLVPMIAVVGPTTPFLLANTNVEADLQSDGKHQMFRSCSADDGVHLTMWQGTPVTGSLLWHGYYYEASNPGVGPACTPAETKGL